MSSVVLASNVQADIKLPMPKDQYQIEFTRQLSDWAKQVYTALSHTTTLSFLLPTVLTDSGTLVVGTNTGTVLRIPQAGTITKVWIDVKTAPTGAAIIVDVNKNGTTLFTTSSNRPTIAISATAGSQATIENSTVAAGDLITLDIDQVGSTIAGADLTVTIAISVDL